jgi:ABC-type branched-subunit amino acid transport system substrate-binding protein
VARSIHRYGLAALGLIVLCCSCSSGGGSSTTGTAAAKVSCPVKVAAVAPLSGSSKSYGYTEKAGYDQAVKDLNNSATKVLGCPVQITYLDDASDSTKIPGLITKALSSGQYDYVTQFALGTPVAVQFFNTEHKLSIGVDGEEAYNDPSTYPLWFDMAGSEDQASRELAKAVAAAGYKRIALIQSTMSNLGGADEKNISEALSGTGSQLVVTQSVDFTISDASGVALKVQAAHPDAVIADLYGPPLGVVLQALTAQGVMVPRFGAYYAAAGNPSAVAKPSDIANMVVMTYAASVAGFPGIASFAQEVAQTLPGHSLPSPVTAASFGHDALVTWAAAVNSTKSFNDQKLAAWLEANGKAPIPALVSFDPKVTGFSSSNHLGVAGYALAKAGSMSSEGLFQPATITPKG